MKAAEHALLDAFRVDFESAKKGVKISTYLLIENILSKMARTASLGDLFDRNIECWTQ